ncbi:MAG TPA: hypothetical protein VKG26_00620 [Bacteroidia bacterium]|nr:hypothetical protein [Bacteroidia bacterium]
MSIFISMILKITKQQAIKILNAIPKGSVITISVKDANAILGKPKTK